VQIILNKRKQGTGKKLVKVETQWLFDNEQLPLLRICYYCIWVIISTRRYYKTEILQSRQIYYKAVI